MEQAQSTTPVFIYALMDPDGEVRYVGASQHPEQRLIAHLHDPADTPKTRWLRTLQAAGTTPIVLILEESAMDAWQERERFWIRYWRDSGSAVTNSTDGGYGLGGATDEARAKISTFQREAWADPERRVVLLEALRGEARRAAISAALTSKPKSPEHIAKLPQNHPGWHQTEEAKARISANHSGHRWSADEVEALRVHNRGNTYGIGNRSRTGQVQSEAERQKKSLANKGKPKSPEWRERHRVAMQEAWKRRKANGLHRAGSDGTDPTERAIEQPAGEELGGGL